MSYPDFFDSDRALLPVAHVHTDTGPLTAMQRLRWFEKAEAFLRHYSDTGFIRPPMYRNLQSLVAALHRHHKRICLAAFGSTAT